TGSPAAIPSTSAPICATRPANSAPSTHGSGSGQREVPARESRSLWLSPHACTSTSTSCSPQGGSSTCAESIFSGPPCSEKTAANTFLVGVAGHARVGDRLGPAICPRLARPQAAAPQRVRQHRPERHAVADGDADLLADADGHVGHPAA